MVVRASMIDGVVVVAVVSFDLWISLSSSGKLNSLKRLQIVVACKMLRVHSALLSSFGQQRTVLLEPRIFLL